MTISAQTKLRSAKRELAMRRSVYPKWVESGRMTQSEADHEIAVMADIVHDYQMQADQLSLPFELPQAGIKTEKRP